MRRLSRNESRLIALLILVAMLVLFDLAVVSPILAGFAERAEQRALLIRRYEANDRMIAAIPRLGRLAEARSRAAADYAMAATDSASAGEMLRARLQSAVLAAGGQFLSGEDVAAPANTAAARITVRIAWAQLPGLLASLQNRRPFLTISSLAIGADDALVTGRTTTLDVQIEAAIPTRAAATR